MTQDGAMTAEEASAAYHRCALWHVAKVAKQAGVLTQTEALAFYHASGTWEEKALALQEELLSRLERDERELSILRDIAPTLYRENLLDVEPEG